MDINKTEADGTVTLEVSGHLNTATARELEREVDEVLSGDPSVSLTFDFTGLDYISSAGLRVLMGAYKTLTAAGGSLKVTNPCDGVREVFDITGLVDILDIE